MSGGEKYKANGRLLEQRRRQSMASTARCEECDKRGGVVLRYKLNPRNLHAVHRKLCLTCGNAGGWAAVYWERAA